jgi:hypothetical protein
MAFLEVALDRWERRELIKRDPDPHDRTAVVVIDERAISVAVAAAIERRLKVRFADGGIERRIREERVERRLPVLGAADQRENQAEAHASRISVG